MANIFRHTGFPSIFNWGLVLLLALNLLLFIAIAAGVDQKLFSLPSTLSSLRLKPWTPISYMFAQSRPAHLIFNMIALGASGFLLSRYLSSFQLIKLYLLGGFTGALFFMFYYAVIPDRFSDNAFLDGGSAAIYALLTFIALNEPVLRRNYNPTVVVAFRWILGALLILNLLGLTGENYAANLSHLGGAFGGALYFIFQRLAASAYRKKPSASETDRILAKVRKSGYSSLDAAERETLIRKKR